MRKKINVQPGDRYGRLTVVEELDRYVLPNGAKVRRVKCRCDCGSIKDYFLSGIRKDKTRSCGCMIREKARIRAKKHGYYGTALYNIWIGIKKRTTNPRHMCYMRYGGRGIKLADEWRDNPEAFIDYIKNTLGDRPSKRHSLDRIDNEKGYEPGNLRWATPKEQARNTHSNLLITIEGNKYKLVDALKVCTPMVNKRTLLARLHAGWDPIKAFMTPAGCRQGDYSTYGI